MTVTWPHFISGQTVTAALHQSKHLQENLQGSGLLDRSPCVNLKHLISIQFNFTASPTTAAPFLWTLCYLYPEQSHYISLSLICKPQCVFLLALSLPGVTGEGQIGDTAEGKS